MIKGVFKAQLGLLREILSPFKLNSRLLAVTIGLCSLAASYATWGNDTYLDNLMQVIKPNQSQIGLLVKDLDTNSIIYQHNADALMLPASTLKLLSSVSALSVLGEDFTFKTQVYTQAPIIDGTIIGNLYLVFNGDPTLDRLHLQMLFKKLSDQGLENIHGKLILVGESLTHLQAPGWVWDDLGICFAAPVSSFIIGKNCINAILKPRLATYDGMLSVANYLPVTLTSDAVFDKDLSERFCELSLEKRGNNKFHLTGCYPGNTRVRLAIAIDNPSKYAKDTLAQVLNSQNIRLSGGIEVRTERPLATSLAANYESKPLNTLLKSMLLGSDNLIADSLVKRIGKQVYHQPGNFTNGVAGMKRLLSTKGIDLTTAQISDGSGLSRYNLISARQLMQVLTLIATEPQFVTILDSLPIAGVSGTLKNKASFKDPKLKNKIWAKTGSMQGVANLAGFIKDKQDKPKYAFVIFENGLSPAAREAQVAPFAAIFLQGLLEKDGSLVTAVLDTAQSFKHINSKTGNGLKEEAPIEAAHNKELSQ